MRIQLIYEIGAFIHQRIVYDGIWSKGSNRNEFLRIWLSAIEQAKVHFADRVKGLDIDWKFYMEDNDEVRG